MNPDERVEAQWCVDSGTGERVLIDIKTNQIIARKGVEKPTEIDWPTIIGILACCVLTVLMFAWL